MRPTLDRHSPDMKSYLLRGAKITVKVMLAWAGWTVIALMSADPVGPVIKKQYPSWSSGLSKSNAGFLRYCYCVWRLGTHLLCQSLCRLQNESMLLARQRFRPAGLLGRTIRTVGQKTELWRACQVSVTGVGERSPTSVSCRRATSS